MHGTRRIKDLQRPYGAAAIPSWPPRWVPSYDGATVLPTGEDGMLTWVERMPNGPGLWLTMRLDGVARRGPLLWSGSPSLAELERVLRSQIGRVIRDIGLVEIDTEPISDEKPVAEIARSAPPWST
jgi:hypothetical protein